MGGCCCCASKGPPLSGTPAYYYCPRASEERVPLSSLHDTSSALSTGLLVDTNLDTSIPDTYIPPSAPLPYDIVLGCPQTPPRTQEISVDKNDISAQTNAGSAQEPYSSNMGGISKCDGLKESESKLETDFDNSEKDTEVSLSKPAKSTVSVLQEEEEDDSCPICLEEYDEENPKFITKCDHDFHLACILEWMERSDTCPVCDQEIILSPSIIW